MTGPAAPPGGDETVEHPVDADRVAAGSAAASQSDAGRKAAGSAAAGRSDAGGEAAGSAAAGRSDAGGEAAGSAAASQGDADEPAPVESARGRRAGVRRAVAGRVALASALAVVPPAVALTVWWYASAGSLNPYYPPLERIFRLFGPTWTADRLVGDVLPSVGRLTAGYLLAVALGVALGVLIGLSWRVRAATEPVLEFLRAIPPPVLVPIFILLAGYGSPMKIMVIVSGCLWPILLNTVEGIRATDEVLADTCRAYGIRGPARLWHLVIRSASPQIVTGMRQALSIGIILMVISEMTASTNGLGFTIVQFQRSFELTEMWTGILLLGLLGVALAGLLRLFERWALRWYFGQRQVERERA